LEVVDDSDDNNESSISRFPQSSTTSNFYRAFDDEEENEDEIDIYQQQHSSSRKRSIDDPDHWLNFDNALSEDEIRKLFGFVPGVDDPDSPLAFPQMDSPYNKESRNIDQETPSIDENDLTPIQRDIVDYVRNGIGDYGIIIPTEPDDAPELPPEQYPNYVAPEKIYIESISQLKSSVWEKRDEVKKFLLIAGAVQAFALTIYFAPKITESIFSFFKSSKQ